MRVFSSRKERQKKSDREKEKKKKLREKALSLSPQQHALSPQTHLCVLRELVVSTHLDVFWRYSLSARAYSFIYNTLSLSVIMCMYSAALFFRFLKLRNKIRTLSLYSRNSKKRRRRRRRVYFLFPSLSQTLASRARLKINVFSLSLSAFPKKREGL